MSLAVYLTLELRPGDDPISGRVSNHDNSCSVQFGGWTGLIAGIDQLWRQAVQDLGQQTPTLNVHPSSQGNLVRHSR
jgi:hypothetical protein